MLFIKRWHKQFDSKDSVSTSLTKEEELTEVKEFNGGKRHRSKSKVVSKNIAVEKTDLFYDVESNILEKYHHLETSQYILAGKLWTVKEIDDNKNKVYVTVAVNGKPPHYTSGNIKFHPHIGEKMMEVLCNKDLYNYIDENTRNTLIDMRRKYQYEKLTPNERPIWIKDDHIIFDTFTGTVISRTLNWMLKAVNLNVTAIDGIGRIKIETSQQDFKKKFHELYTREWGIEDILNVTRENELFKSKYTSYLPNTLHFEMHKTHEVDIAGAQLFLIEKEIKMINH